MKKRSFIGKYVDITKVDKLLWCEYGDYEEYDDNWVDNDDADNENKMKSVEIYLPYPEDNINTERSGYNMFSVVLILKENKIVNLKRIGHCHMCGGQGTDDELRKYPCPALEEAAEKSIQEIICSKTKSKIKPLNYETIIKIHKRPIRKNIKTL
ncbi:MAG: hypothetical protein ACE15F_09995 [bacterium]